MCVFINVLGRIFKTFQNRVWPCHWKVVVFVSFLKTDVDVDWKRLSPEMFQRQAHLGRLCRPKCACQYLQNISQSCMGHVIERHNRSNVLLLCLGGGGGVSFFKNWCWFRLKEVISWNVSATTSLSVLGGILEHFTIFNGQCNWKAWSLKLFLFFYFF